MRRALWITLAIGLVSLTAWHLQSDTDPSPAPSAPETSHDHPAPTKAANAVDGTDASPSVVSNPANQSIRFETLLLADGQISAATDSVRLGLGFVLPDEARTWQEWRDGSAEGAGPASYSELATVERWIDLPAARQSDGSVRVGPMNLPAADRYDLQARSASPLHFYLASFTADAYPANVKPAVAAGLRVRYEPTSDSDVRVLLRRTAEIDANAPWQALMAREAPQLLGAYDDTSVAVSAETILAPLPPGPLDVILEIDGIESERLSVQLRGGTIAELQFDPVKQAVAQAVSAQLQLDFVIEGSRRAIPDIEVTWFGGKTDQTRTTDVRGSVSFKGVDRQRVQRFGLQLPGTTDELPRWPEQKAIEFTPDAEPESEPGTTKIRKTIELRPLQWLMVRTGTLPIPRNPDRNNPYPIFVLQREQVGTWTDVAADHFIPIADGIAASLQKPGRYRLVALQAPWSLLYSTSIQTQARTDNGRYQVSLIPDPGRPIAITVLSAGIPLARAPVSLRGPIRGQPASAIDTDTEGQIRLNGVTEASLELEVPGYQFISVDLRSASVVIELKPEHESD
jgi:hypothetical protein